MKFLIHANAPHVKTGYGVQCAQLISALKAAGHEPAVSSTYGLQAGVQNWNGIRVYGCGYDQNSNDLLHSHADHWFAGETGWIITLIDVWAMINPRLAEYNVAAWVPIDHFPAPGEVLNFFSRTQAVPVAMSRFGERLLFDAGLDPVYIPLSIDTRTYQPTPALEVDGQVMSARQIVGIPDDKFVVGMVAMNKGWAKDRKGFNEAFWAFGQFAKRHPEAVLYMHSEKWGGAEGQNLVELSIQAGIEDHQIVWAGGPDQYGYRLGYTAEHMAACYTAMDVLLAPSHGEGFCVPLIEAQACGVPVIATDFSSQTELAAAGWTVTGQPEHNPAMHANYVCPFIDDVLAKLEDAFEYARDKDLKAKAVAFASQYDVATVFEHFWLPFIAQLETPQQKLDVVREPMPDEHAVAVICPIYKRAEHIAPLVKSFLDTTDDGEASLVFVVDQTDRDAVAEVERVLATRPMGAVYWTAADRGTSCAANWNTGYAQTTEPWVLLIGDDVRFHEGWLDHARKLSADFDVIGTNDSVPPRTRNPKVVNGSHSDHSFFRRTYVEEHGGCLEGPGVLAPEAYAHWFVDMEMIKLARARGVFTPCLDSVIEHLHPGYDGNEEARQADPTYMTAVEHAETDQQTFRERLPLIEMQRTTRAKI